MELSQDFKEFIKLLNDHSVEYLVVGGYAVAIHGFPRTTGDIDFWINSFPENALRMVNALTEFGFASPDISVDDFLKEDYVVQLGFPPFRIDILTGVSGLSFDECYEARKEVDYDGERINFISLHHLKINKRITGRDKDHLDLSNLPD